MPEAIIISNTASSAIPLANADTVIQLVNLKPTTYDNIRWDGSLTITTTGASLTNLITLKLKITPLGKSPITLTTWTYKTDAAIRVTNQQLCYIANIINDKSFTVGGAIGLYMVASANDAATVFTVNSQYVTGID